MSPLKTLRGQLGSLLGAETNTEKFSFLKCVGRSLALVKSKQESDLKVKTFAPPYVGPPAGALPAACCREPQQRLLRLPGVGGQQQVTECVAAPGRPLRCPSSRSGSPPAAVLENPAASPGCHKTREELMEEVMLVRAERKQLEWTRQELLRKGKDLLAQNRHRRNQARDGWKKKYFETKKDTVPLEEKLRGLQQQLEMFYHKLLQQLQARDQRGKPRHRGRSSVKNELIIQIMTETHEIDTLKRKMEDAKMKLLTETRLRKQAATELRALKAELAQKKSHTQPL
ncbi:unnamed protein product [Tetraodon nigroviridis]|uniref:(spotted green pufferfish) hypothetical protein n=1 Tax=Tetraodon nigroviridis TaxID=99883 RepID=Q4RU55_TETNG|nr:unnamed protein product [Tetraodon nigroviridis]